MVQRLYYVILFFFSKYKNTYKILLGGATKSVIYNKKIQFKIINAYKNLITRIIVEIDKNIDAYINTNFDVYFYKKPLFYQLHPYTENSNYWSENKTLNFIFNYKNKLFGMDTNPELGVSIMYNIAFFMNYLVGFLIFVFICWILYFSSTKKIVRIRNKNKTKQ